MPSYSNSLNFLPLNSVVIQETKQAPSFPDSDWLFSTQELKLFVFLVEGMISSELV